MIKPRRKLSTSMIIGTGMSPKSLPWPKTVTSSGRLIVLPLLMVRAIPRVMFIIARVVTKGTIFSLVIEKPLIKPIREPRINMKRQAKSQFIPISIIMAPLIPVRTVIPDTERSMPAPRITKVMPIETIPVREAAMRIFIRLRGDAYFPPEAIEKIMIKTIMMTKSVPFSSQARLLNPAPITFGPSLPPMYPPP
jgi:hypothetical protein